MKSRPSSPEASLGDQGKILQLDRRGRERQTRNGWPFNCICSVQCWPRAPLLSSACSTHLLHPRSLTLVDVGEATCSLRFPWKALALHCASRNPVVTTPSTSHFPGEPQPRSDSVFSELNQIPPSTLLELTSDLKEMR